MPHAAVRVRLRRGALALRLAVVASLVLGVAAALPSSAAEGAYVDDRGRLEAPGPTPGSLLYSAFCPDAPPEHGVSVWLYDLPEHAAVVGASLTVVGQSPTGPASLTGTLWNGDCTYDRFVSPPEGERGLSLGLQADDRYLLVTTSLSTQVDLLLTVTGDGVTQTPPPAGPPSPAPANTYVDDRGRLEAPLALTPGRTFYSSFCPDAPPEQGISVWLYDLPAHAAVSGAALTVSGRAPTGTAFLSGTVYDDDCTYDRGVSPAEGERGLSFVLDADDRYLVVSTILDAQVDLLLTIRGEGITQEAPPVTATPSPTAAPGGSSVVVDPTVRERDSYDTFDDPLFVERSTAAASFELQGQWGMRTIRAPQAWKQQATGAGVRVAVLDTGLDVDHPDFACAGKIARVDPVAFPRFADVKDVDGHGTHVAGIVGACTNNGEGVVGTAPDATILPIQALSPTEATAERLGAAIVAAVDNGAHVINMSLGFGAHSAIGTAASELEVYAGTVDPALEYAVSKGVVVVAAAGNSSFPVCGYPALAEDLVCVGSTDRRDVNAWYGNFPVTPHGTALVAPGGSGTVALLACNGGSEGVLSTYSRDAFECGTYPGYSSLDGTSMASPHVAGVAALAYDRLGAQRSPTVAAKVVQALVEGAKDLYAPGYDPVSGEGRVDALAAVAAAEAMGPVTTVPTPPASPTPAPAAATQIELVAPAAGQTTDDLPLAARLSDAAGRIAGADVVFRLRGERVDLAVTAVTDQEGVATAVEQLDVAVGTYVLSVEYAGGDGRLGSSDDQPFEVLRDDTTTTLAVSGKGSGRTLAATLADHDTASRPLVGASVVFFADGHEVGSATTDERGVATYAPTGSARGAKAYEARFAGDDRWTGSSGRATA